MLVPIIVGFVVLWLFLKVLTGITKDATKGVNALNNGIKRLTEKTPPK